MAGVRDLLHDYEMGVAAKSRCNFRVWHPNSLPFCDGAAVVLWWCIVSVTLSIFSLA